MQSRLLLPVTLAALPLLCWTASTRTWVTSSSADFEKGELKGVSLRSDGRVTLAPATASLFDPGLAYVWALARDSKGVLYAGGGPGARVFRYARGKAEKVADLPGVEVHALAIDRQDRVYAATFPDGRVYRLKPGAAPEEFYNPRCKYIWSMLFDREGGLFIATGDTGEIHRVSPAGKGAVFFRSEDTHVRSLALAGDNLIAGTDPTGLIVRITPQGEGFVLFQLPKREVTAVAVSPDGAIYAAGAGVQHAAVAEPPVPAAPGEKAPPSEAAMVRTLVLSGGSEVYRIDPAGAAEKVWSHPKDVVYAIAFDAAARPVLGAGNKGSLYRVDTPSLSTALTSVDASQITALIAEPGGALIAATANVGKVLRFGPQLEPRGTLESDVFDSGSFAAWGRLISNGESSAGQIRLESHSGNLDRSRNHWSAWSAAAPPPARFVQWRATLTASAGVSPVLDSVEQAYLSRNIAPRVEEIESTPPNYKYPAPVLPVLLSRTPATISLPAMGKHGPASTPLSDPETSVMSFARGFIGVRWSASDENSDPLLYSLEIRGVNESVWKPLKDKLTERHYSFDSSAFPDGEYRIRVTATDQPGNPPGAALTGTLESSPILIDNTPPVIAGLNVNRDGESLHVAWSARDALNVIKRAEYSLDGADWTLLEPVTHLSDSLSLRYDLRLPGIAAGEHTVSVRVTDEYENTATEKTVFGGK